jgi:hypothetical protein
LYADNTTYANIYSAESFAGSIEALWYPKEFDVCNGIVSMNTEGSMAATAQTRESFGFSWRKTIGNAEGGTEVSHEIHVVYGCHVSPSEDSSDTDEDSLDGETFSWDFTGEAINVDGFKPTAHFVFYQANSTEAGWAALETLLYGGTAEGANSTLATPAEFLAALATTAA